MSTQAKQTLLVFSAAEGLFGLPAERVQSVCKALPVTRVPYLPEDFIGVFNFRGDLCLAIDFATRLGKTSKTEKTEQVMIVIDSKDPKARPRGLLVDHIERVAHSSEISTENNIHLLDADTFLEGGIG